MKISVHFNAVGVIVDSRGTYRLPVQTKERAMQTRFCWRCLALNMRLSPARLFLFA